MFTRTCLFIITFSINSTRKRKIWNLSNNINNKSKM